MKKNNYFKPSVTVDILVFSNSKTKAGFEILLIKRKNEPCKDQWAFPGGFIEEHETLSESAARELLEETSIKIDSEKLNLITVAGDPGRDPRGRTISIIYYAVVDKEKFNPKGMDDAKETRWFSTANLPVLAFDHDKILKEVLKKLIS